MQSYSAPSRSSKVKEMAENELPEIKSIPVSQQGIRPTSFQNLMEPLRTRFIWIGVFILSIGCIPFILLKSLRDFTFACFGLFSFKETPKNILLLVIFPVMSLYLSLSSLIPFSKVGKKWVMKKVFPAYLDYEDYIKQNPFDNIHAELPINTSYYQLESPRKLMIESIDIPFGLKTPFIRVCFCGNASFYQITYRRMIEEDNILQCNGRAFNYPGIKDRFEVQSITDLVNSGIIQIFQLAQLNNWSNQEVERYIHLYGRSLGGAIALQVASYFKQHFNLSLMVIVDRSFSAVSDVIAVRLRRMMMLPIGYGKYLAKLILSAAGGWDLDSVSAIQKIDANKVYYFNVAPSNIPKPTRWTKLKNTFGLMPILDPDKDIPAGSTLAEGLQKANIQGCHGYNLFAKEGIDSHFVELSKLSTSSIEFKDALQCYAAIFANKRDLTDENN